MGDSLLERVGMTAIHVASTGVDPGTAKVARVTLCDVRGGEIVGRYEFDNPVDMPVEARRINGMTSGYLAFDTEDWFEEAHEEISLIGNPVLIVNNAPWTLRMMGYELISTHVLDVAVMDRIAQGARSRPRTWHAMCVAWGVRSTDVCASYVELVRAMCTHSPALACMDLGALVDVLGVRTPSTHAPTRTGSGASPSGCTRRTQCAPRGRCDILKARRTQPEAPQGSPCGASGYLVIVHHPRAPSALTRGLALSSRVSRLRAASEVSPGE